MKTPFIESNRANHKGMLNIILSSFCVSLGQLFWKLSVSSGYVALLAGFLLYGLGALLMIFAYRFGRLSVLQPMLSLSYVLSILLAFFVLKEDISILNCVGILIIIAGVVSIAGGDLS